MNERTGLIKKKIKKLCLSVCFESGGEKQSDPLCSHFREKHSDQKVKWVYFWDQKNV